MFTFKYLLRDKGSCAQYGWFAYEIDVSSEERGQLYFRLAIQDGRNERTSIFRAVFRGTPSTATDLPVTGGKYSAEASV